jgi:hypothetical protein
MSKSTAQHASTSTSRATRMVRFALAAFGIGILAGQGVSSIKSVDMDSKEGSVKLKERSVKLKEGSTKMDRVKEKYGPFKRIALLGERNSGTSWITEELKECFESEGIKVTAGLTKDKHFFQHDDGTIPRQSTLAIAMFRNPYDWAAAMNKRPHHSPEHLRLDMEEFLTKPWTMERPERDLPYAQFAGPFCQLGYRYKEVIPCLRDYRAPKPDPNAEHKVGYSAWDPQYELRQDGSGMPYDSLLHLREAKIQNILSVKDWDWVADLKVVHYETLLEEGTEHFLKQIEDILGVQMQCKPSPPAPERLSKYQQTSKVTQLINSLLNWKIEKLVGYHKRST